MFLCRCLNVHLSVRVCCFDRTQCFRCALFYACHLRCAICMFIMSCVHFACVTTSVCLSVCLFQCAFLCLCAAVAFVWLSLSDCSVCHVARRCLLHAYMSSVAVCLLHFFIVSCIHKSFADDCCCWRISYLLVLIGRISYCDVSADFIVL